MDELTNEREQSQACLSYAERERRRRSQQNDEALELIPIPEGLEARLSAKIDEWEQEDTKGQKAQRRRLLPSALRYMAVAASVALVLGVGLHLMRQDKQLPSSREGQGVGLAEQDTYQDPLLAQQEAERALNLLAYNLNKGLGHLEKVKALSDKTEKSLNKQLKVLKRYETDNH